MLDHWQVHHNGGPHKKVLYYGWLSCSERIYNISPGPSGRVSSFSETERVNSLHFYKWYIKSIGYFLIDHVYFFTESSFFFYKNANYICLCLYHQPTHKVLLLTPSTLNIVEEGKGHHDGHLMLRLEQPDVVKRKQELSPLHFAVIFPSDQIIIW